MIQFTDEVPKICGVVVEGCIFSLAASIGGDRRLGAIVLDLLGQSGYDTRALSVETLHQYFSIVSATVDNIIVRQVATP